MPRRGSRLAGVVRLRSLRAAASVRASGQAKEAQLRGVATSPCLRRARRRAQLQPAGPRPRSRCLPRAFPEVCTGNATARQFPTDGLHIGKPGSCHPRPVHPRDVTMSGILDEQVEVRRTAQISHDTAGYPVLLAHSCLRGGSHFCGPGGQKSYLERETRVELATPAVLRAVLCLGSTG